MSKKAGWLQLPDCGSRASSTPVPCSTPMKKPPLSRSGMISTRVGVLDVDPHLGEVGVVQERLDDDPRLVDDQLLVAGARPRRAPGRRAAAAPSREREARAAPDRPSSLHLEIQALGAPPAGWRQPTGNPTGSRTAPRRRDRDARDRSVAAQHRLPSCARPTAAQGGGESCGQGGAQVAQSRRERRPWPGGGAGAGAGLAAQPPATSRRDDRRSARRAGDARAAASRAILTPTRSPCWRSNAPAAERTAGSTTGRPRR